MVKSFDLCEEYYKFINRNQDYTKKIISYEKGKDNSIVFTMRDGHKAVYYPVLNNNDKDR